MNWLRTLLGTSERVRLKVDLRCGCVLHVLHRTGASRVDFEVSPSCASCRPAVRMLFHDCRGVSAS
jgi:hypothetical protein